MDGVSAESWQLVTAIQDEGDGSILMRLYYTHSCCFSSGFAGTENHGLSSKCHCCTISEIGKHKEGMLEVLLSLHSLSLESAKGWYFS